MKFNKINKKLICALSFTMIGFLGTISNVDAASKTDVLLLKPPGIGSLEHDFEEQAKVTTKIDGIKYHSYLKVTNQKGYISTYKNNDVWGLRTEPNGIMYYAPNIGIKSLTLADRSAGVVNMIRGSSYVDNKADIYWNNSVTGSVAPASGHSDNFGSFDKLKNFKPGYQKTNSELLLPQWPKYPKQNKTSIAGNKESEGKHYFYGMTVDNASQRHASKVTWRNSSVKAVVGTNKVVKGEWRFLGSNIFGQAVTNSNLPRDQGNSVDKNRDFRKAWKKTYPKGGYNQAQDWNTTLIRRSTWARLKETIDVGSVSDTEYSDIFTIGAPASNHVTGVVTGEYNEGGKKYGTIVIPAKYNLDLALNRMEIKDGNQSVYVMKQKTTDAGIEGATQTSSQYVKLQPGYEYVLEIEIENRSGKVVYNPTFNVLGAVGGNATNINYNLVDKGSNAPAYWVFTNTSLQEEKEFGKSRVAGAGYFSVNGERLKRSSSTGQKIVPSLSSGRINPGETKVIRIKFTIDGADKNSLKNKFAETNPNNVRIRLAADINKKHSIADEVFEWGGIEDDRVKTSTDNEYSPNDVLNMNKAFYTQDMEIGGSSEYTIKDSRGKKISSSELMSGGTYKIGINVKNPSKIWGTVNKPKIDYEVKDAKTGTVIKKGSAQGTRTLGKADSDYVEFDVTIPSNSSNQIQVSAEINEIHKNSKEDWYKDNNKFVRSFGIKSPADLLIQEAMGEKIGDEPSPSTVRVFAGETVALKVFIKSPVNYIIKPVEVRFSYKKDGNNISATKNIGAMDGNNNQTIVYPYVAPEKAGVYEVVAHLNPNGKINEIDSRNNKHIFRVVVEDDVEKYAQTTHIEGKKPDGSENGNSNITVSKVYSSYTPSVTIQRRDPYYVYNEEIEDWVKKWGSWYDYNIEFRESPLYVSSTESLELTEVNFKSKFTTDRRIEGKDTDLINSQGFVNLVGGSTASERERIAKLGRIKAGYGFELEVKTKYKTNVLERYKEAIKSGINTRINGVSLSSMVSKKISQLRATAPDSEFRVTSRINFFPSPLENTINAKDQVLSIVMPDKKIYKSTQNTLVEKVSGGTKGQEQAYNTGATWSYRFTQRDNGLDGTSRRYYLKNNVPNGEYYLRVGTSKLGTGGLLDIDNGYDAPGKPTRAYAAKDIKIEVYGGREDDLKDKDQ